MRRRWSTPVVFMLLAILLGACGGDENTPLSTGEQGGQVSAPDALNANGDGEGAENVAAGDAETIGEPAEGQEPADDGAAGMPAAGDMPAFMDEWQAGGATVSAGGEVPAPLFEGVAGQSYFVNDADLQVYRFASAEEADAAMNSISSDGATINGSPVRWAGSPHFYRQDNTIIVYIGDDAATLDLLSATFGEPFAGGATSE